MSYNIFELISRLFKSMFDVLTGKVQPPREYDEVQDELISARKEFAEDRATEIRIEKQIEEVKAGKQTDSPAPSDLNEQLIQHRFKTAKLANRITNLEEEFELAAVLGGLSRRDFQKLFPRLIASGFALILLVSILLLNLSP